MGSRVVPKFWKHNQYQNFGDIDIEMEEDIKIDTIIDSWSILDFYIEGNIATFWAYIWHIWQKRISQQKRNKNHPKFVQSVLCIPIVINAL